eukprot:3343754-Rhodomonas_salina.1
MSILLILGLLCWRAFCFAAHTPHASAPDTTPHLDQPHLSHHMTALYAISLLRCPSTRAAPPQLPNSQHANAHALRCPASQLSAS